MLVVTGVWGLSQARPERLRNFEAFARHLKSQRAALAVAELSFDGRFCVDQSLAEVVLRVRGGERHRLFQKESLCNLLVRTVGVNEDVIAWVDADVMLLNQGWQDDCRRELERFPVCQLFSESRYMDKYWCLGPAVRGAACRWSTRDQLFDDFTQSHPGLAWAARGELVRKHGLYDRMASGSNDTVMYRAFTDMSRLKYWGDMSAAFRAHVGEYCDAVGSDVDGRVGFVHGCAVHLHHGDLRERDYAARWRMPWYDPTSDVRVGDDGVLEWSTDEAAKKFADLAVHWGY